MILGHTANEELLNALNLEALPPNHVGLCLFQLYPGLWSVCLFLLGKLFKDSFEYEVREVAHVGLVQYIDLHPP